MRRRRRVSFERRGRLRFRRMRFDGAGRARATDAAATVADGERRAFKRTPGAFKKRSLHFRAKAAPFTRDVASAAAAGAAETASSSAPAKKDAAHSRSGLFVLRRFDFSAIRAKAAPVKAFKRTPGPSPSVSSCSKTARRSSRWRARRRGVFQVGRVQAAPIRLSLSQGRRQGRRGPRPRTARDTRARGTSACDDSSSEGGGCVIGRSRGAESGITWSARRGHVT